MIGRSAFCDCTSIDKVELPFGITEIQYYVFAGCSFSEIKLPSNLSKIHKSAFEYCRKLTAIDIPNSVTIIGQFAFRGCTALKNVNIPDSVESIDDTVFKECPNLEDVRMSSKTSAKLLSQSHKNQS